jgi:hypothetical protein
MSVRRRTWRDPVTGQPKEAWMIDVTVTLADGRTERIRRVAPLQNKRAAERYEFQVRQEALEGHREEEPPKKIGPTPTLAEFCDPFVNVYAVNNNKLSGVEAKRIICNNHLIPAFGSRRLDDIGVERIEEFKSRLLKAGYSPKTVNNCLAVLARLFAVAVEWKKLVEADVPKIQWLKVPEADVADEVDVCTATVEWIRRRAVLGGIAAALDPQAARRHFVPVCKLMPATLGYSGE